MANITDQFVTSFSELYYSKTEIGKAGSVPTEEEIRTWFDASNSVAEIPQVTTLTLGGTSTGGDFTITVDGTVLSTTIVSSDTGALAAGKVRTTIGNAISNGTITGITESGATDKIILTGEAGKGDFVVAAVSPQSGTTVSESVVTFVAASGGTTKIPLVMEIGTLSNEATVIDTPTFGEVYKGKLRGQLDGGQLDAQLYWAPRDERHQELRRLSETGQQIYVGIKWKNQAGNAGDSEFVYFDSFVSSFGIDTTFDDVAKVSCTFVVDGAEHFAGETA